MRAPVRGSSAISSLPAAPDRVMARTRSGPARTSAASVPGGRGERQRSVPPRRSWARIASAVAVTAREPPADTFPTGFGISFVQRFSPEVRSTATRRLPHGPGPAAV